MKKLLFILLLFHACFPSVYAQEVRLANRQSYRFKLLYMNRANELSIVTNGKYKMEDISIQADNAEIQKVDTEGSIIVIPKKYGVVLKIFYKDTLLSKENTLLAIPERPHLQIFIGKEQAEHQLGKSIAKEKLTSITFQAKVESNVALDIPFDSQYQISHVEIFLTRGNELVGEPIVSISHTVDLQDLMKKAQKGDRLVAYIVKVERLTYKGNWEEERLFHSERIVSFGIE